MTVRATIWIIGLIIGSAQTQPLVEYKHYYYQVGSRVELACNKNCSWNKEKESFTSTRLDDTKWVFSQMEGKSTIIKESIDIHDGGRYVCGISTRHGCTNQLIVQRLSSGIRVKFTHRRDNITLMVCFSYDWYPKPEAQWYMDEQEIGQNLQYAHNLNKTYNVAISAKMDNPGLRNYSRRIWSEVT